jgi:hypothetical protein
MSFGPFSIQQTPEFSLLFSENNQEDLFPGPQKFGQPSP